MDPMTRDSLASTIDLTCLSATASVEGIRQLCQQASAHRVASVCVNPFYVSLAAQALGESAVKACTVVGFPLGATSRQAKAAETVQAIADGATEIDMVLNLSALMSADHAYVRDDIRSVVHAAGNAAIVKVILETCYLDTAGMRTAAGLCVEAGAHFVKTSTGLGPGGATVEAVRLLKETVGQAARVKASGGIRDLETARHMIEAGAERLGIGWQSALVMLTGKTSDHQERY